VQTSDALCRATSPREAGSNPQLEGPRGASCRASYEYAARRIHRARAAGAAAGLGRRSPNGPERLPSDRPEPRGSSGLGRARCSLARLCPAPCCLPRTDPASSKAGRSLQAIPSKHRSPQVAPRAAIPTRKMRLSDFCNQLTTRAPYGLPDSRARHQTHSLAGADRAAPIRLRPKTSDGSSGGASLDGEPPASA